jgi:hypothetical protein
MGDKKLQTIYKNKHATPFSWSLSVWSRCEDQGLSPRDLLRAIPKDCRKLLVVNLAVVSLKIPLVHKAGSYDCLLYKIEKIDMESVCTCYGLCFLAENRVRLGIRDPRDVRVQLDDFSVHHFLVLLIVPRCAKFHANQDGLRRKAKLRIFFC